MDVPNDFTKNHITKTHFGVVQADVQLGPEPAARYELWPSVATILATQAMEMLKNDSGLRKTICFLTVFFAC